MKRDPMIFLSFLCILNPVLDICINTFQLQLEVQKLRHKQMILKLKGSAGEYQEGV